MAAKKDALWARALRGKYLKCSGISDAPNHVQGIDFVTWRGICHGINALNKGL